MFADIGLYKNFIDGGWNEGQSAIEMHVRAVFLWTLFSVFFRLFPGNGLIDETEFLQWVGRIQALRDDTQSQSSGSSQDENLDDVTQDLIAAFR